MSYSFCALAMRDDMEWCYLIASCMFDMEPVLGILERQFRNPNPETTSGQQQFSQFMIVAILRGWKYQEYKEMLWRKGCVVSFVPFFCCKVCWLASTLRRKSQTDGAWTAGKVSADPKRWWCEWLVFWYNSVQQHATALWLSFNKTSFNSHCIGAG